MSKNLYCPKCDYEYEGEMKNAQCSNCSYVFTNKDFDNALGNEEDLEFIKDIHKIIKKNTQDMIADSRFGIKDDLICLFKNKYMIS